MISSCLLSISSPVLWFQGPRTTPALSFVVLATTVQESLLLETQCSRQSFDSPPRAIINIVEIKNKLHTLLHGTPLLLLGNSRAAVEKEINKVLLLIESWLAGTSLCYYCCLALAPSLSTMHSYSLSLCLPLRQHILQWSLSERSPSSSSI